MKVEAVPVGEERLGKGIMTGRPLLGGWVVQSFTIWIQRGSAFSKPARGDFQLGMVERCDLFPMYTITFYTIRFKLFLFKLLNLDAVTCPRSVMHSMTSASSLPNKTILVLDYTGTAKRDQSVLQRKSEKEALDSKREIKR